MKLYKKVSKAGGLTIPSPMRHALNIPKGAAVEVEVDEDKIIITKHTATCMVCGTAENVAVVGEVELCKNCSAEFERKMKESEDNGITAG